MRSTSGVGVRAYRLKHSEYLTEHPKTGEMVDRHKDVDHAVFMHLPAEADEIESISKRLKLTFPKRVIVDTPLQVKEFEI